MSYPAPTPKQHGIFHAPHTVHTAVHTEFLRTFSPNQPWNLCIELRNIKKTLNQYVKIFFRMIFVANVEKVALNLECFLLLRRFRIVWDCVRVVQLWSSGIVLRCEEGGPAVTGPCQSRPVPGEEGGTETSGHFHLQNEMISSSWKDFTM